MEGVVGHSDRFRPGPHPVHVDVGVADAQQLVLLGYLADGRHRRLTPCHKIVQVDVSASQAVAHDRRSLDDALLPLRGPAWISPAKLVCEVEFSREAIELRGLVREAVPERLRQVGELRQIGFHQVYSLSRVLSSVSARACARRFSRGVASGISQPAALMLLGPPSRAHVVTA